MKDNTLAVALSCIAVLFALVATVWTGVVSDRMEDVQLENYHMCVRSEPYTGIVCRLERY